MKRKKVITRLCSALLAVMLIFSVATPASAAVRPPISAGDSVFAELFTDLPDEKVNLGAHYYWHNNGTDTMLNLTSRDRHTWEVSSPAVFEAMKSYPDFAWSISLDNLVESESLDLESCDRFISENMATGTYEVYAKCSAKQLEFWEYEEIEQINQKWYAIINFAPVGGSSNMVIKPC